MSERRSTQALFLVFLMLTSVLGQAAANETQNEVEDVVNEIGVVYGDLTNFNVETGSEYLLIEEDQPVVSATSFIKQAWMRGFVRVSMTFVTSQPWRVQHAHNTSLAIR